MEKDLKKEFTLKQAIVRYQDFIGNARQKKLLFSGMINTFLESYKKKVLSKQLIKS
ncbi:hypothetical protein [Pedobacter aquatilis]|uniref:hypothetical protein n=1 Tax=Pedobacter aquatilis TaxID=351343 RepID=UPI0029314CC7|nr:hypothetical protein [Pedobacter aquatilis]